jgi:ABC-type multidrug transport system permease subunit
VKKLFKTLFYVGAACLCFVLFVVASYALNYFPDSDYYAYLLMLMWVPFMAAGLPETIRSLERYLVAVALVFLATIIIFGHAEIHEKKMKERRFGFRYGNVTRPFNSLVQNQ